MSPIIVYLSLRKPDGIGARDLSALIIIGWRIVILKGWWRRLGEVFIYKDE
jgi:hypothetical protein